MADNELLPCPFCGGTAPEVRSNGIGDFYVICAGDEGAVNCGASTSDHRCETKRDAIARWNRRAERARPPATLEARELVESLRHWLDQEPAGSFRAPDLRKAIAFIERAAAQPSWQPIETAPKDGSYFVTARFVPGEPRQEYEIAQYAPYYWDAYELVEGDLYRKTKKAISEWSINNFYRATHWVPLPAPPEAREGEQK